MAQTQRPILAATDLTLSGDEAVRQADRLARRDGCPLMVLGVVPNPLKDDPAFPDLDVHVSAQTVGVRQRAVESTLERVTELTGRGPDDFVLSIEEGVPATVIVARAEEVGAGLVVLGVHPSSERDPHPRLGPVVGSVMRHAHGPVLLARPGPKTGRILVATDFSDPSLPAVEAAVLEARRRQTSLTIVHCLELGSLAALAEGPFDAPVIVGEPVVTALRDTARTRLAEALARFGAQGEMVLLEGPPAAVIPEEAALRQVELLVIGTVGKSGLRRLLLGSVAEAVARHATCSVLIVRLHRTGDRL
jgi:nucleotide-binding universal stress UspA family protein